MGIISWRSVVLNMWALKVKHFGIDYLSWIQRELKDVKTKA